MPAQEICQGTPELARAVAVNDAKQPLFSDERVIEKFLGPAHGLVDPAADDVELGKGSVAWLQLNADAPLGRGAGPRDDAQLLERHAQTLAPNVDFRLSVLHELNEAF